jgi:hypothetical protein
LCSAFGRLSVAVLCGYAHKNAGLEEKSNPACYFIAQWGVAGSCSRSADEVKNIAAFGIISGCCTARLLLGLFGNAVELILELFEVCFGLGLLERRHAGIYVAVNGGNGIFVAAIG